MSNADELINRIMSSGKLSGALADRVYGDEPILRPASKMKNYIPPEYEKMRAVAHSHGAFGYSFERLFREQAKLMENFEDDYDYHGEFFRYYPTYQSMNDEQLRGYFSWRTKVRRGDIRKTSLSFAFVYIYELINLIGAADPADAFEKLEFFGRKYSEFEPEINRYLRIWLTDMLVYYDLPLSVYSSPEGKIPASLSVILNRENKTDAEIFAALNSLSSFNITNSRFYKKYPADTEAVVCRVFDAFGEYYEKHRKHSLCEMLFGKRSDRFYNMFSSAVFYDPAPPLNREYSLGGICTFRCVNGRWSRSGCETSSAPSRELGLLLRGTDHILREKYGFDHTTKAADIPKYLSALIGKTVDAFLEEKKQSEARRIEIDVTKLCGIRAAAEITRERLIVEDSAEYCEADFSAPPLRETAEEAEPAPAEETAEEKAVPEGVPLNETEYEFMRIFLGGKPYADFLRSEKIMLSVMVDSVNEKLFDMFADTVILFDGETPELTEDYVEELKGLIK